MEPLLLIANADAGTADSENLERALTVLRSGGDVEVASTSNPGELDGVLHRAGSRRIVVAGGDGSLHAIVAALHRRRELEGRTLGLIPFGTGNDYARGQDIPLEPEEAARVVLTGRPRLVDILVDCRGEVVVNSVHIGVGAQASRKADRWKSRLNVVKLGRLGYLVGAAQAAVRPPFVRLRVEVDGKVVADVDRPVLQVAIGNSDYVGGGTELTPDATPHDGQADILVSFAIGPLARIGYAARLARGEHHERDDVAYLRGRTVQVTGGEFWCSADGEIDGPERNRTWTVEPAAFQMLLP
ncbi:diacylglycerol kinase family enzyme [Nocardioides massiliensis]|uniref:Diacylglycerol kinase family enzyme n=2 Tax=Nocardioides massiliensis TaxID=1325935 RepID=A0ABT9NNF0_9ACTN|nr:diacylglycerol kinase family protein [Nocardioides massiliensis]MDP9821580.1 diacylglycerol kinase family enzyme [Nocardioides massiliensis]